MAMLFDQLSPVNFAQLGVAAKRATLNGMEIVLSYVGADIETQRMKTLGICDVSAFSRVGIKGIKAAEWLISKGFKVPTAINTWTTDSPNGLILRLGKNEFLIESIRPTLIQVDEVFRLEGLYEVARYDAAFILSGVQLQKALSEICALDLSDRTFGADAVMMTSVAGVSVTMIRQTLNGEEVYRLWCDGSYGNYMWSTLTEIAADSGGGVVGLDSHFYKV